MKYSQFNLFPSYSHFLREQTDTNSKESEFTDEFGYYKNESTDKNVDYLKGLSIIASKKNDLEYEGPFSSKGQKELEAAEYYDSSVFDSTFFILKNKNSKLAIEMLTDKEKLKQNMEAKDESYPTLYIHYKKDKDSSWKKVSDMQSNKNPIQQAIDKYLKK